MVTPFSAGNQDLCRWTDSLRCLKVNELQLTGEADEMKNSGDEVLSIASVLPGQAYARLDKVGDQAYINQPAKSEKK